MSLLWLSLSKWSILCVLKDEDLLLSQCTSYHFSKRNSARYAQSCQVIHVIKAFFILEWMKKIKHYFLNDSLRYSAMLFFRFSKLPHFNLLNLSLLALVINSSEEQGIVVISFWVTLNISCAKSYRLTSFSSVCPHSWSINKIIYKTSLKFITWICLMPSLTPKSISFILTTYLGRLSLISCNGAYSLCIVSSHHKR